PLRPRARAHRAARAPRPRPRERPPLRRHPPAGAAARSAGPPAASAERRDPGAGRAGLGRAAAPAGRPRAVPAAVRGTVALLARGLVRRALSPARPPADPRLRRYRSFPDLPPLRAAAHARRGPRDRVAGAGRGGARPARGGRAGRRVHPPLRGGGTLPVRGGRLARLLRAGGVVPPGAAGRRGGAVTQAAPVLPDQRPSGSSLPVQRESRYVLRRGAGRGG